MSLAGLPTYLLLVNTKTFFKCSKYFFKYSVWAGLDLKAPKTLNMMHRRSKKWDVGIWTNRWYIIPWGRIDYLDNIVHSEGQLMFDFLIRNIFNISHPQAQSSPLSSEHSRSFLFFFIIILSYYVSGHPWSTSMQEIKIFVSFYSSWRRSRINCYIFFLLTSNKLHV